MHRLSLALPIALLSSLSTASAQTVLRVDALGGGGAFTTIQAAVDAAAPGDTVLVTDGFYNGIAITRSVRVVAENPNGARVLGPIEVTGLPAGSDVYLRGFGNGSFFFNMVSVRVEDCAGSVWIDECEVSGAPDGIFSGEYSIENSSSVAITRCFGDQGISITDSTVSVFDSEFIGIDGFGVAGSGLPGATVSGSFLHATNSSFTGGVGNAGVVATDGGIGATIENNSTVDLRGSSLSGGEPGFVLVGPAGSPGAPAVVSANSTLTQSAGPIHTLDADPVTREGDAVDYLITGPAGHIVVLTFAIAPDPLFFAIANGTLLTGASFFPIGVGTIPASGSLTIPTTVPELGPGVDVRTLFVQVLALDAAVPAAYAGSGRGLTLLDSAF